MANPPCGWAIREFTQLPVDDAKKIIDESPTLEQQLEDLIEKGYQVEHNESGKVSYVGEKMTAESNS